MSDQPSESPYAAIGSERLELLVNCLYDHMDRDPVHAGIRGLHPESLDASRQKLLAFLSGWLGGPQLHAERYGPICIRSAHDPFPIDAAASKQWMDCMRDALMEAPVDDVLREALEAAFARMTEMLRNRDD